MNNPTIECSRSEQSAYSLRSYYSCKTSRDAGTSSLDGLERGDEFGHGLSLPYLGWSICQTDIPSQPGGMRFSGFFALEKSWRDALERECQKQSEHIGELASTIELTREEEKKRIARELHDELGQQLSALKMGLAALEAELHAVGEQKSAILRIADLQHAVDRAISSVRRVAAGLRPAVLDDLGLVPALEWLVDDFRERSGICATLHNHATHDLEFNDLASTALFRIAQEALTNVARHAKNATEVRVELACHSSVYVQTISDNGLAIATDGRRMSSDAYPSGLAGIRQRVRHLGGTVIMGRTLAHDGFSIVVSVPVHAVISGRVG